MNPLYLAGIDQPLTSVILGTMTFGDSVDEQAAAQMVDDFLAAGETGIDTARRHPPRRPQDQHRLRPGNHLSPYQIATAT